MPPSEVAQVRMVRMVRTMQTTAERDLAAPNRNRWYRVMSGEQGSELIGLS